MRILILFSQPWRVGGAETHVESLIQGLVEHQLIMAVNKGSDKEKVQKLRQKYNNLEIVEIQARGINIIRWLKDIFALANIIRKHEIEVISAQQRTAGIWAYILSKYKDIPFVVTMHDPWHRAFFKKLYSKLFSSMIVVSENLKELLCQRFGFKENQVEFINNGIDFAAFTPQDKRMTRDKLGITHAGRIILHVSRLSSVKGAVALALLDSMSYVLLRNPDSKLIIIGEGPLRSAVEEKAVAINVNYPGSIDVLNFTDRIVDWYNAADLVVGEGRVAIEAIACERPIVAIRNGNLFFGAVTPENIRKAIDVNFDGTVFSVTPAKMAEEIDKAFQIQSKQTTEMAQFINSLLSISDMAQKYYQVLMKAVRGSAR